MEFPEVDECTHMSVISDVMTKVHNKEDADAFIHHLTKIRGEDRVTPDGTPERQIVSTGLIMAVIWARKRDMVSEAESLRQVEVFGMLPEMKDMVIMIGISRATGIGEEHLAVLEGLLSNG